MSSLPGDQPMQSDQTSAVICAACSHQFELTASGENTDENETIRCPECGEPVRQSGPAAVEAPATEFGAINTTASDFGAAGKPTRSSRGQSPVGFLLSVLAGGLTAFGFYWLIKDVIIPPQPNEPAAATENSAQVRPSATNGYTAGLRDVNTANGRPNRREPKVEIVFPDRTDTEPDPRAQNASVNTSPSPEKQAKRAAGLLELAKRLLKRNKRLAVKDRLQEIIDEFPATDAAAEAREMLKGQ